MLANKIRTLVNGRGLRDMLRSARPRAPHFQIIDISNPYIEWLCFANAGMLVRGNLYCFDHALKHMPRDTAIVEIGSFCGLSTNVLTYYKERNGLKNPLFTCDRWEFEGAEKNEAVGDSTSLTHQDYREFVKSTYLRNVAFFSQQDLPYTVELFSDEFFAAWRNAQEAPDVFGRTIRLGGPIGFCYIDGNHSYGYARRDFENCDQFLVEGGFILFDDSADGSGWDVCKVVAEVSQLERYDLVIKNPNYLFRKRGPALQDS